VGVRQPNAVENASPVDVDRSSDAVYLSQFRVIIESWCAVNRCVTGRRLDWTRDVAGGRTDGRMTQDSDGCRCCFTARARCELMLVY